MDLGLEILLATRPAGKRYTHREIAAYCGCTWAYIWLIEQKALRKMKRAAIKREIALAPARR